MDIAKYTDYFHDGYVNTVLHIENNVFFSLESAVIENLEEITDRKFISNSNTLKGILSICNIKSFKIANKKYEGLFEMQYDDGEILDLEIDGNKVLLLIEWKNRRPKPPTRAVSKIEIEAEQIFWENIPDLKNNYCLGD